VKISWVCGMSHDDQRIHIQSQRESFPLQNFEYNQKGEFVVFRAHSCGL